MNKLVQHTNVLAITACLLWASAFAAIKIGLAYMPPLQFAGIRFMISGFAIALIGTGFKNYWRHIKANFKRIALTSLFNTVILYACFYAGIAKVPAALAALIIGAQPLFIAVISHLVNQNDRLTKGKVLSITLGIIGLIIISADKLSLSGDPIKIATGIGLLLINNLSAAFGNILVSRTSGNMPPLVFSSSQLFLGGLTLFLIALVSQEYHFSNFPITFYVSLSWLSFLSAAAIGIWFVLLQRPDVQVSDLNMWKFIIPVFGAILSWIILPEEGPNRNTIIGMLFLCSSLILLNYINRKKKMRTNSKI